MVIAHRTYSIMRGKLTDMKGECLYEIIQKQEEKED